VAAAVFKQKVAPLHEVSDLASVLLWLELFLVPGQLNNSASLVNPVAHAAFPTPH